jgi:hypothetical protein
LSSPPLTGDTGEVMFALKQRAEAGGDASLGYRDWGIEGNLENLKKIDLDDRELWAAANPALGGGRVTMETIGRLRKAMTANEARGFAREVLGLWPKKLEGGGAIDPALWASLFDPESRRDGDVAIGVDIAPDRKYAAMGIYGLRADGLGHEQVVVYRPGTDWILDAVVEWRNALDPVAVAMGRGTAASLEVELEKLGITRPVDLEKPQRGDLAVANATEMSAATGQFLDGIRQKIDRWAPDTADALTTSVAGAAAKQTGDSLVWARKESNADTSPLVSVTLARWSFYALAHLIDQEDGPPNIW